MPLRSLNHKVRVISLILALLALLVFGYALVNGSIAGREAALRAGEVDTMNIANSLSTRVNLSFRAADMLLQELSELYGDGRLSDAAFQRLMEKLMARQGKLFPEMDSVQIIDERARVRHRWPTVSADKTATTDDAPPPAASASRAAIVTDDKQLRIGSPVRSDTSGQWIIPLTRPLLRQGRRAGLIRVGVNVDHFAREFEDFDIGRNGALVLATSDGTILLRRPFDQKYLGDDMRGRALFRDHVQHNSHGWATVRSPLDDQVRLHYFTHVAGYPLFVTAALARDEILAGWRRSQHAQLLVMLSVTIVIVLLALYLLYTVRMRDRAEREIEEKNQHLHLLTEKLRSQALLDGMTGLANRRYLDEQLHKAIQSAARSKSTLSLVMFDVDWFKTFNDLYGHVQGDYCLQGVARVLQGAQRRQGDLAARYGGEEFALLLPDTGLSAAHRIARQVLDSVRALQIPHEGSHSGVVTISAGVVSCMDCADTTITELFAHADHALYMAKNNGRDRVQDWHPAQLMQNLLRPQNA